MQASARFKQSLLAVTLGTLATGTALAQTPAPAAPPPPDNVVTANVGIFSEYIFRGISQTGGKPAVQGGFDWAHSSGFYAGTWASNVSWLEDFGLYSRSSLEWDFYGGYKANFGDTDFFWDVGTIYYYYPGSRNPGVVNADTWEVYGALGWKWISVKARDSSDRLLRHSPNGQKTDGTVLHRPDGHVPDRRHGLRAGRPRSATSTCVMTAAATAAASYDRLEGRRLVHGARGRAEGHRVRRVLHRQQRQRPRSTRT